MKKILIRLFIFIVVMVITISLSYATKIYLKNGRIIEGEIISYDNTSVTIKEPMLGIFMIPREKIIKIEPPLEEKEVKEKVAEEKEEKLKPEMKEEVKLITVILKDGSEIKGKLLSETMDYIEIETVFGKQRIERKYIFETKPPLKPFEAKPKKKEEVELPEEKIPKPVVRPPAPKKPIEEPVYKEFPEEKRERKLISFYIGGGMSNINGGDLNAEIRDINRRYTDYDNASEWNYNANIKELDWMRNIQIEVIFNLSPYFGLGLGVEYITKDMEGTLRQTYDSYSHTYYAKYYYENVYYFDNDYSDKLIYKLEAIPINLNLYIFIPLGNISNIFLKGGVGYYYGKHEYTNKYDYYYHDEYVRYNYYGTYLGTWINEVDGGSNIKQLFKCNTLGYHGSGGIDLNLSNSISLVAECVYRNVNFKDWKGEENITSNVSITYGWKGYTLTNDKDYSSHTKKGKLWFYKYYSSGLGSDYIYVVFREEEPEPSDRRRNIRLAEINLNGISLRAGIKISF